MQGASEGTGWSGPRELLEPICRVGQGSWDGVPHRRETGERKTNIEQDRDKRSKGEEAEIQVEGGTGDQQISAKLGS